MWSTSKKSIDACSGRQVQRARRLRRSSASRRARARATAAMRGRSLDPNQRDRKRGRGDAAGHSPRRQRGGGLREQREHQALTAADVDERPARTAAHRADHRSIQRVAAKLAARELPGRDARATRSDPTRGGRARQTSGSASARVAREAYVAQPVRSAEHAADDDAAHDEIRAKGPRIDRARPRRASAHGPCRAAPTRRSAAQRG